MPILDPAGALPLVTKPELGLADGPGLLAIIEVCFLRSLFVIPASREATSSASLWFSILSCWSSYCQLLSRSRLVSSKTLSSRGWAMALVGGGAVPSHRLT